MLVKLVEIWIPEKNIIHLHKFLNDHLSVIHAGIGFTKPKILIS